MTEIEKPCISSHKHTQHVVEAVSLLCALLHCCVSKFLFCFVCLFFRKREIFNFHITNRGKDENKENMFE